MRQKLQNSMGYAESPEFLLRCLFLESPSLQLEVNFNKYLKAKFLRLPLYEVSKRLVAPAFQAAA